MANAGCHVPVDVPFYTSMVALLNSSTTVAAPTASDVVNAGDTSTGSQTLSPNTSSIIPGTSVPVATTVAAPTASDLTNVNGRTSDPNSAAPTPTPTVSASIGVTGSPSQSVVVQPGMPLEVVVMAL